MRSLSLRLTKYAKIAEGDVGPNGASHNHTDQDHDLLPANEQLGQSCLGLGTNEPERRMQKLNKLEILNYVSYCNSNP